MTIQTNGANSAMTQYQPQSLTVDNTHVFEPSGLDQALTLAKVLHAGGLLPRSFTKPESVVTAIILGRELGMTAMQSIRGIHVIEGKPTLSADTMVALVKRSPVCEYFQLLESTNEIATYETKRRDDPKPTTMSYTKTDATAAGKWGSGTWKAHPSAMLRARASSALARAVYQDLVMGIYDPDELAPVEPQQRAERYSEPQAVEAEIVTESAGISEAQRRRMYAIAKNHGVTVAEIKNILRDNFEYESTTQLTQEQYEAVCDRLIPGWAEMAAAIVQPEPSTIAPPEDDDAF